MLGFPSGKKILRSALSSRLSDRVENLKQRPLMAKKAADTTIMKSFQTSKFKMLQLAMTHETARKWRSLICLVRRAPARF